VAHSISGRLAKKTLNLSSELALSGFCLEALMLSVVDASEKFVFNFREFCFSTELLIKVSKKQQ